MIFPLNTVVFWDPVKTKIPCGAGHVVGIATAPQASIGRGYIVQLPTHGQALSSEYPYTHTVVFENMLRLTPYYEEVTPLGDVP